LPSGCDRFGPIFTRFSSPHLGIDQKSVQGIASRLSSFVTMVEPACRARRNPSLFRMEPPAVAQVHDQAGPGAAVSNIFDLNIDRLGRSGSAPPDRFSPGQNYKPDTLSIRFDRRDAVPWSKNDRMEFKNFDPAFATSWYSLPIASGSSPFGSDSPNTTVTPCVCRSTDIKVFNWRNQHRDASASDAGRLDLGFWRAHFST
jgi:hypothetical protein